MRALILILWLGALPAGAAEAEEGVATEPPLPEAGEECDVCTARHKSLQALQEARKALEAADEEGHAPDEDD